MSKKVVPRCGSLEGGVRIGEPDWTYLGTTFAPWHVQHVDHPMELPLTPKPPAPLQSGQVLTLSVIVITSSDILARESFSRETSLFKHKTWVMSIFVGSSHFRSSLKFSSNMREIQCISASPEEMFVAISPGLAIVLLRPIALRAFAVVGASGSPHFGHALVLMSPPRVVLRMGGNATERDTLLRYYILY